MSQTFPKLFALAALLALSACANRLETADNLAGPAGLKRGEISAGQFRLTYFSRVSGGQAPINVYLEGDGLAWQTSSRPSSDPTPVNPMGLSLASLDSSPNVIYLARPCQYTKDDRNCQEAYWTDRRFSEEVIASMNQAIDKLVPRGRSINLTGYSGGGAVAALIAASRKDVTSLRTVAGNLDHVAVNRHHGVSQMPGSLNAIDVAPKLATLPQEHFVGEKDSIVPPFIAQSFVKSLGDRRCAAVTLVNGATHGNGWADTWKAALRRQPKCGQ
jgi:hypothetical protein